jgi:branched-chain amino acid transport system ATP-binding protein
VRSKEVTVLVGPNGSGKSTLLKTVMGMTQVYSGKILFEGKNMVGLPPHAVARMGIAYLPQVDNVFVNLKVRENLLMAGYTLSKEEIKERVKEVLEAFPELKDSMDRRAGALSGGERQMLAMAMALMRRPKIMLFDEPTASLAPKVALKVLDKIVGLRDDHGITIVLAEQNAKKALEYGDKALLLIGGKVVYEGDSKELLQHPELGGAYLGIRKVQPLSKQPTK